MAEGERKHVDIERVDTFESDVLYFYCELCYDDGTKVEAEGFCVDCHEYLCKDCYSGHKRSRCSRHHELLDKDSMPKDNPLSTDRVSKDIATKCTLHSCRPVEFYCKQHDTIGCTICFLTIHNNCTNESITEKSENILDSKEYEDFIQTLEALKNKAKYIISQTNRLRRSFAVAVEEIQKFKKEIVATLEDLEQNIIAEAKQMMSYKEKKIESVLNTCKKVTHQTETLLADLKSLQASRRVCQVYISMKKCRAQVTSLESEVSYADGVHFGARFRFRPNLKLQDAVKKNRQLGNIKPTFLGFFMEQLEFY